MSLDDFYIRSIEQKKKGNMELYKDALIEIFGEEISWNELKNSERKRQIEVMSLLEKK